MSSPPETQADPPPNVPKSYGDEEVMTAMNEYAEFRSRWVENRQTPKFIQSPTEEQEDFLQHAEYFNFLLEDYDERTKDGPEGKHERKEKREQILKAARKFMKVWKLDTETDENERTKLNEGLRKDRERYNLVYWPHLYGNHEAQNSRGGRLRRFVDTFKK